MPSFHLRTDKSQKLPADAGTIVLDLFHRSRSGTIHAAGNLLDVLSPSQAARDLLVLAAGVYAADKVARRKDAHDGFTRDFQVAVPVAENDLFADARATLERALNFLTGDTWSLHFRRIVASPRPQQLMPSGTTGVSLFSGGLDSLAGAIELLSSGEHLVLLGHHEGGPVAHLQIRLADALEARFGNSRAALRQLRLGPAKSNARQAHPLPGGEREETTRARSFLFIAAALALADTIGPSVPVYMPENGFIGINVPLVPARSGALSTRTTHPFFIAKLREIIDRLGLGKHPLENPFRLSTKGEILASSLEPGLLAELAPQSISCAHPTQGRWNKEPFANCGTCWPCLIRRASMCCVGWDSADGYRVDALRHGALLRRGSQKGASLRAMVTSLIAPADPYAVLRNGPIPDGEAQAFDALYRRGRDELLQWIRTGGSATLHRLVSDA